MPSSFSFTAAEVLAAMRDLASGRRWDHPVESLTPGLVGRLLGQLRLRPRRTATSRSWSLTPADLTRLARAYGLPIPTDLAGLLAAAEKPPAASPS